MDRLINIENDLKKIKHRLFYLELRKKWKEIIFYKRWTYNINPIYI